MFKNFIKIAVRNITRNKAYSAINILGLTLGITCSSLLFLFVIDEQGYDKFHENADNIYRVVEIDSTGDETRYFGQTTPPVGPTMVEDYEEVKKDLKILTLKSCCNKIFFYPLDLLINNQSKKAFNTEII